MLEYDRACELFYSELQLLISEHECAKYREEISVSISDVVDNISIVRSKTIREII